MALKKGPVLITVRLLGLVQAVQHKVAGPVLILRKLVHLPETLLHCKPLCRLAYVTTFRNDL